MSELDAEDKEPQAEVASEPDLKTALESAQQKAAENWDLFLRARADLENAERRAKLDRENERRYGIFNMAREILPVIDSLDQGIQAAENSNDSVLKEGMSLTRKLLIDALSKFDIQEIDPVGEMFDPKQHEALTAQESEASPNQVLSVVQKGFSVGERILRPARVIVAKEKS